MTRGGRNNTSPERAGKNWGLGAGCSGRRVSPEKFTASSRWNAGIPGDGREDVTEIKTLRRAGVEFVSDNERGVWAKGYGRRGWDWFTSEIPKTLVSNPPVIIPAAGDPRGGFLHTLLRHSLFSRHHGSNLMPLPPMWDLTVPPKPPSYPPLLR